MHLCPLPSDALLMSPAARRYLLISLQPRDNPLPIFLLVVMNHHLRRLVFLKHCLVSSEACVILSG